MPYGDRELTIYQRLFKHRKVDENGCWIWTGCIDKKGYGRIRVGNRIVRVHIVSYEHFIGERTPGLQIQHSCDVKACFNPDCLSEGDIGQNNKDAYLRGCQTKLHYILDPEKVADIRMRLAKGERATDLAKEYKVPPSNISMIKHNKIWKVR